MVGMSPEQVDAEGSDDDGRRHAKPGAQETSESVHGWFPQIACAHQPIDAHAGKVEADQT
jgi:hypothetical protein